VKNRPILMKFGVIQQIVDPMTVKWPKFIFFKFKMADGRHVENRFFGHISSTDCLISAIFLGESRMACWQTLRDKNCQFKKKFKIHYTYTFLCIWRCSHFCRGCDCSFSGSFSGSSRYCCYSTKHSSPICIANMIKSHFLCHSGIVCDIC